MDKTSSPQTSGNQTKLPFGLSCDLIIFTGIGLIVVLILVGPTIAQWGYCRGWWLKSSPWAYSWWLCECSSEFEQSLYPDNIEVVVSACRSIRTVTLSLDGHYMIVGVGSRNQEYLLDLVTGSIQKLPYQGNSRIAFWTDTLAYVSENQQLIDVTDQTIINLIRFRATKEGDSITLPPEALQAFQEADRVLFRVLLHKDYHVALALSANPKQNPDKNYYLSYLDIRQEQLKAFFFENGIDYETFVLCPDRVSCISHDGRFETTGITISTVDGQLLTEFPGNPSFRKGLQKLGWAHNDSGIYLRLYGRCIIEGGMVTRPAFCLPQPIVKLKVPG